MARGDCECGHDKMCHMYGSLGRCHKLTKTENFQKVIVCDCPDYKESFGSVIAKIRKREQKANWRKHQAEWIELNKDKQK